MIDYKQNGKRNNGMDNKNRTTTIQPIDKVLIKVHGTHHPPVDM